MEVKYRKDGIVKEYNYNLNLMDIIKVDERLLLDKGYSIISLESNPGLILQVGFHILKETHKLKYNEDLTEEMINSINSLNKKKFFDIVSDIISITMGSDMNVDEITEEEKEEIKENMGLEVQG